MLCNPPWRNQSCDLRKVQYDQVEKLLTLIREHNPVQYGRFDRRLRNSEH